MKLSRIALSLAIAGFAVSAHATNGYFSHGYGMKAKGMAGAATTNTEDTFFGANNPAAAAFAGNRMDLGVDLFSPRREASRSGSYYGYFDGSAESDSNYFLVPEFGYNRMVNPNLALGVTVYGNGGMNTDYPPTPVTFCGDNLHCGTGRLGVDLMQLIVAPTAAFKIAPNHSVGISPLLGYQRFRAQGLDGFGLVNQGYDSSFGYGVRVGYIGKITPTVTIGAAYASKMNFEEFDKYAGLFAEQGDFDIPENFNIGISWQATPTVRLAVDYQRINYSDVASVANPSTNLFIPAPLGADNGPGFGWDDIDVWKVGVEYKHSKALTLRAGYNHGDNPISPRDVTFNILAPGVVKDHVTLGFTYTLASGNELTMAYMHAFKNDVSGPVLLPFGGTDKIEMYQNALGIQYSWKM